MFRPAFIRSSVPQRIPPYPSDPVFTTVKQKTASGNSSVLNTETFDLDSGIYETTITTPLKTNVSRIIEGEGTESTSIVGRVKQVHYNIQKTKCYAHICNDYIALDDSNMSTPHLETKTPAAETGNIYSGYGDYYIVRSMYGVNSKQATNVAPPQTRLPSIHPVTTSFTVGGDTTTQTTSWHILAGYNSNSIPIDLQKTFFSTSEVVQV